MNPCFIAVILYGNEFGCVGMKSALITNGTSCYSYLFLYVIQTYTGSHNKWYVGRYSYMYLDNTAKKNSAFPIGWSCRVYCSYTRPFHLFTRLTCGASPNRRIWLDVASRDYKQYGVEQAPLRLIKRLVWLQKRQIHRLNYYSHDRAIIGKKARVTQLST